ncbi:MAG: hemerythrin domain-containing protein [Candidatus Bipolaricaulia bacterium]
MKPQYEITEAKIKKLITKAVDADEKGLKAIRKDLIGNLGKTGAKTFVDTTAKMLKGELQIEGCNDPRIPIKRIFTLTLPELERTLGRKKFDLPPNHPILGLFREHENDVERLKAIKKEFEIGNEEVIDKLKDYYKDVDTHILKEEEALLPRLEEKGMGEHLNNLRQDHKEFKEKLVRYFELLQSRNPDKNSPAKEEFTEKFIPSMSNHLFRESFVLYPATLELISEKKIWSEIEREFDAIDKLDS